VLLPATGDEVSSALMRSGGSQLVHKLTRPQVNSSELVRG